MFEELYVNGMIELIYQDATVARIYPYDNGVYVKLLKDGYDFETNTISTAKQLIKIRMGIQ